MLKLSLLFLVFFSTASFGEMFSVDAVKGLRVVISGKTDSLKKGTSIFYPESKSFGRVVEVTESFAVVEFEKSPPIVGASVSSDLTSADARTSKANELLENSPSEKTINIIPETTLPNSLERLSFFQDAASFQTAILLGTYVQNKGSFKLKTNNSEFLSTEAKNLKGQIELGYGISDNVKATVSGAYLFDNRLDKTTKSTGNTVSEKEHGLYDPTIELSYRFFRPKDRGVAADITLEFSPKLVDAKEGTTTAAGNAGKGSYTTGLSSIFFIGSELHEVGLGAGLFYESSGKKGADPSTSSYEFGSKVAGLFGARYRFHPSPIVFFEPGFEVLTPFNQTLTTNTATPTRSEASYDSVFFKRIGAGIMIAPWLLVETFFRFYESDVSVKETQGTTSTEYSANYSVSEAQLKFTAIF